MKMVYSFKKVLLFISLVCISSLLLFFTSCSLTTDEEEGSLSFTLPEAMTRGVETPNSYSVILLQGRSGNYKGKMYDKVHESGSEILIRGLRPVEHTLIVKGESDNFLYEKSEVINVKLGKNSVPLKLQKKDKAKVTFNLSSLSCPPDTTFSYTITNSRGEKIVEKNNVPFSSNLLVPYSLVEGKYSVTLSSSLKDNEKYIVNTDDTFTVSSSMTPFSLNVSVIPFKTFYVSSSGTASGTGSEKNPFISVKKAIDTVIQSYETTNDALIIVEGTITETSPILIDGDKTIEIRGKDTSAVINGNIILDGVNLTLTNLALSSSSVDTPSLNYKNGTLSLGSSSLPQAYVPSLLCDGNTPINIASALDASVSAPSSEITMSNIVEKTIFTSSDPSFISHYSLKDPQYLITESGKVEKVPEKMVEVLIELDSLIDGKQLQLVINDDGVPPSIISQDDITGTRIRKVLEIGKTYNISVNDKASHISLASNNITVNSDRKKNKVSLFLIKEFYVNKDTGDDLLNKGTSTTSSFKTFSRAIEEVKEKQTLSLQNDYTIHVDGIVYSDVPDDLVLSDSLNLTIQGDKSKTCEVNSSITVPQTSTLNIMDVIIGRVSVNDGTVNLKGTLPSDNKAYIREINLMTQSSFVTVENPLVTTNDRAKVTIPDGCGKAVSFTTTPQGLLFESTREDLIIKEDGTVVAPSLTIDFGKVPESNRFILQVRDDSASPVLYTIPITKQNTVVPYFLENKNYTLDIIDNYNYSELSNRMVHDVTTPKCEMALERKLTIGGSGATDTANNGAKPFSTIGGALTVIQDVTKFDSTLPWEILLDSASSYTADNANPIEIKKAITVTLKGKDSKATLNLDVGGGKAIVIDNEGATLKLQNILIKNTASGSYSGKPVNILNGKLELLDGYSDEGFKNYYIGLNTNGVCYIKNAKCKPTESINILNDHTTKTPIILGKDFFDFEIDTIQTLITVKLPMGTSAGLKILELEDGSASGNYSSLFHTPGDNYIDESGVLKAKPVINYNVKDAKGMQISTLASDGYTLSRFNKLTNQMEDAISLTAETGSFKVNPLLEYVVKIDKSSQVIYESAISKGGTPSNIDIKLFEYYVSDALKEGKDISKNHGSSSTSPIDFDRAIKMVNQSNGAPSVIKVMSDELLHNSPRTRKAAVLDKKSNLTITNGGVPSAVIYSTRGEDFTDINGLGIVVPFLIVDNAQANVTFDNITIHVNDKTEKEVGCGALIVRNGSVTLGANVILRTRGMHYTCISVESGGKLIVGSDFKGSPNGKILLHNTTGTTPKLTLKGPLEPDIRVKIGVAKNKAFDFSAGQTIIDFTTHSVDGTAEKTKFILTDDSYDPVPQRAVDNNGVIEVVP